jgi:hypothetical protein
LTIVLRTGSNAEEEFQRVDSFRASLRRLKAVFPMIEEDLLSGCDFPLWLDAIRQTPDPDRRVLLFGESDSILEPADSPHWRARALEVAFWVYVDPLPSCLAKPSSFLRDHDLARRIRKIARSVQPVIGESLDDSSVSLPLRVSRAAKALERTVAVIEKDLPVSDGGSFSEADPQQSVTNASSAAPPGVIGVIRRKVDILVVIEDGLSVERIAQIFEQSAQWGTPQLVLPASVFRYWLRYYDPYEYSRLSRERAIIAGSDPLGGLPSPGEIEFGRYWRLRLDNILTSVRGDEVFCKPGSFTMTRFRSKVVRAMALRMALERNRVFPELKQVDAGWRGEYEDAAGIFEEIRKDAADGKESSARFKAFTLLRSCADAIRENLSG